MLDAQVQLDNQVQVHKFSQETMPYLIEVVQLSHNFSYPAYFQSDLGSLTRVSQARMNGTQVCLASTNTHG